MLDWIEISAFPVWLDLMLRTACVLGAGLILARVGAWSSAAGRHRIVTLALVLAVAIALVHPLVPKRSLNVAAPESASAASTPARRAVAANTPRRVDEPRMRDAAPHSVIALDTPDPSPGVAPSITAGAGSGESSVASEVSSSTPVQRTMSVRTVIFAFWVAGAAWMLLLQTVGVYRVAAIRRRGVAPDKDVEDRVLRLARRAGLRRVPTIVLVERLSTPATTGILSPVLLLPSRLAHELQGERLDAVLLHELVHVARRDVAVHELARFVRAVSWPVPFSWMAVRSLSIDREVATDAEVVSLLERRLPYAEGLLHVLESRTRRAITPPATALGLGADGRASMVRRVELITRGGGRGWSRVGRRRAAVMVAVLLFAASGASSLTVSASPLGPAMDDAAELDPSSLLLVVDLPEAHGRKGVFAFEGAEVDLDGLRRHLDTYGVRDPRYRDARDPGRSRTVLRIRAHRERPMEDVVAVLRAAGSRDVGIRDTSVSVLGRPAEHVELRWSGRAVQTLGALHVHVEPRRLILKRRATDPEVRVDYDGHVQVGDLIGLIVAHHPDAVEQSVAVHLTSTSEMAREVGDSDRAVRIQPKAPARSRVDAALTASLAWIMKAQREDGSWADDGDAGLAVGRTALALLALLEAGGNSSEGPHAGSIARGIRWIAGQQVRDGGRAGLLGLASHHAAHYGHAAATEALCIDLSRTGTEPVAGTVRRALDYIFASQNPYRGWRYEMRDGDNDSCVTSWMVSALHAAAAAGFDVPAQRLQSASSWLQSMTDDDTGRIGYVKRGELPVRVAETQGRFPATESESITAAALTARRMLGAGTNDEVSRAGLALIHARPPRWDVKRGSVDHHYWFWGARLLSDHDTTEARSWCDALARALVDHQVEEGEHAGSWAPVGPWGSIGGRVYSTALMSRALRASQP